MSDERACDNCGRTAPCRRWSGHLDSINSIRMISRLPYWCEVCEIEVQLPHAEAEIIRLTEWIPKLKARYAELLAATGKEVTHE